MTDVKFLFFFAFVTDFITGVFGLFVLIAVVINQSILYINIYSFSKIERNVSFQISCIIVKRMNNQVFRFLIIT